MAPHVPAPGAPAETDRDQQRRRPPAERLAGQAPRDGVAWGPFTAASPTPLVGFEDPAGEDRAVGFEALAGDDETADTEVPGQGGQPLVPALADAAGLPAIASAVDLDGDQRRLAAGTGQVQGLARMR